MSYENRGAASVYEPAPVRDCLAIFVLLIAIGLCAATIHLWQPRAIHTANLSPASPTVSQLVENLRHS